MTADTRVEALNESYLRVRELLRALREALIGQGGHPLAPLGDVLTGIDAGKSPQAEGRLPEAGERAVLKVSAVKPGGFDATEVKTLGPDIEMPAQALVRPGDLLISRANAKAEHVAAVCLVPDVADNLFLCDKTLRLLVDETKLAKPYAVHALATAGVRQQVGGRATGSTGAKNVSQAKIRTLMIALPALAEQQRIVATLEAAVAAADSYRDASINAQHVAERLGAALLSGELELSTAAQAPGEALLV
jgi:type I restriction enzyme S subunit